ncbi:MAG: alkaline phosphatase family protein, partial [Solirubrobacteraceae bacterium]
RTAGTTYLIYRGRHPHQVAQESALAKLVTATLFRRTVLGPRELFYADLYASRHTGCRGQLGMPGVRDQHSGCVGSYLLERELCDFLLLSLPDNDAWSHRNGPHSQVTSIAAADRQLERVMHAAGGVDAFLEQYAVIVTSDHSHTLVEQSIRLDLALADFHVATANVAKSAGAELALCPSQRAAMLYVLAPDRREELVARARDALLGLPGVDLVMYLAGGAQEAAILAPGARELRFAPGGELQDPRGARWHLEGDLEVLSARIEDGLLLTPDYPDALARAWSALTCPNAGEVLLSAGPGYEFVDWGGADHVGGGSHGSLHRSDSLGALLWCGTGPDVRSAREQWSLCDIAPIVRAHFGALEPGESA